MIKLWKFIFIAIQISSVFGELDYVLKKLECSHNPEYIKMKKCFIEALAKDVHGFNFHVVFKKNVEKIMAFIQLSERDKDSGVQQIIKKISFNLCDEQDFDNLFEKAIFYEVFNGFRVEGMGKLCPIKPGHEYYSKNQGEKFDIKHLPPIIPVGNYHILVTYFSGNTTFYELNIDANLREV